MIWLHIATATLTLGLSVFVAVALAVDLAKGVRLCGSELAGLAASMVVGTGAVLHISALGIKLVLP